MAPFRRVLVANRGEIALRIVRACHELGMEAAAVYSDADAGAAHVRAADVAVRIGPAPAADSYLRIDAIIAAATAVGADAVHPGYGFLSERAAFAEAVEASGLTWVGPPSSAIARLGDKLSARRIARDAGVPHVPGTLEPADAADPAGMERLRSAADEIGFPLLVKASAGGGGRGMRRVTSPAELEDALTAGAREAAGAFGDGTVYLEREVTSARHVEVQLLGDAMGAVIALGERDCSMQRRHQKLVEEAPAPGLTTAARRDLHAMAVRMAGAAGLRNAATCEFLLDAGGRFWFLEVNTRLQVEHPVTELVSGVDIVAEQFRLAAGMPLTDAVRTAAARAADPEGHAIEVRISAEDPARGFAPAPGRVTRWQVPAGPGIRVDTALRVGDVVPPDYDPLVAKLIVHGPDRGAAVARLRRALGELDVAGIQTTLPFHRALLDETDFTEATGLSTTWVDEHWDGPAARARALRAAAIAVALAGVPETDAGPVALPQGRSDGGRSAWARSGRATGADRWPR